MDKAQIWLHGVVTAQGYLLELLLGAQLLARGDPLLNLESVRTSLKKQIQFDMRVPPTDTPSAYHLPIQAAAAKQLDDLLDRVKTQLAARPKSGDAG